MEGELPLGLPLPGATFRPIPSLPATFLTPNAEIPSDVMEKVL